MSNGIHAIKGFEYQATVILDRLFDHCDRNGPTARVRSEGIEDLDLYWTEGAVERRHYLQIKKPREDNNHDCYGFLELGNFTDVSLQKSRTAFSARHQENTGFKKRRRLTSTCRLV